MSTGQQYRVQADDSGAFQLSGIRTAMADPQYIRDQAEAYGGPLPQGR